MAIEETRRDSDSLEIPPQLRARLAHLPVFEPPPRRHPRRRGWPVALDWRVPAALAAGLAVVLVAWDREGRAPDIVGTSAASMDRQLADSRPRQPSPDALRVEFELASLESRLQRAHESDGPVPEALWSERRALQRELLALYRAPSIVRI
jgi:hypothetical protein